MPTREEVEGFLSVFHVKMKVFGVVYRDDRGKNLETLQALEIVPSYRSMVLEKLKYDDYVEGPVEEALNQMGEMWVFGKNVKKKEIYIKITIGAADSQIICISFHIAEHPLSYPLKKSKKTRNKTVKK